jgi:putative ABC transport system ATP-binding protein
MAGFLADFQLNTGTSERIIAGVTGQIQTGGAGGARQCPKAGDGEVIALEIRGLRKAYWTPEGARQVVIDLPEFRLEARRQVAMSGESGAGKTTLLNLIAGISTPDSGSIRVGGREMTSLSESARDRLRATTIGYIFQTFNLLQGYTCLENVLLGMSFGPGADRDVAVSLLERVGLGSRLRHYPRQLSTGQQQRVAVARALANRPQLVLADEPTGNLDQRNSRESLSLIREICGENGAALLLVSHDPVVLAGFDTVEALEKLNRAGAA